MRRVPAVLVSTAVLVTSCAAGSDEDAAAGSGGPAGTVTVMAAASLTEPFEALARRLAEEHPDLDVTFSFGPSSGLVEQAIAGAPADVLATADVETMDAAVRGDVVDATPRIFARNTLALAVPAGNPGAVTGLDDLAREELRVAICEPEVPCGAAADGLLDAADVTADPDTLSTDVKGAASLVALDEVDAALIYPTDVAAAGDAVETIDVPEAEGVVNEYPVARLAGAPNPAGARAVVDAITGEPGRSAMAEAGFLEP